MAEAKDEERKDRKEEEIKYGAEFHLIQQVLINKDKTNKQTL